MPFLKMNSRGVRLPLCAVLVLFGAVSQVCAETHSMIWYDGPWTQDGEGAWQPSTGLFSASVTVNSDGGACAESLPKFLLDSESGLWVPAAVYPVRKRAILTYNVVWTGSSGDIRLAGTPAINGVEGAFSETITLDRSDSEKYGGAIAIRYTYEQKTQVGTDENGPKFEWVPHLCMDHYVVNLGFIKKIRVKLEHPTWSPVHRLCAYAVTPHISFFSGSHTMSFPDLTPLAECNVKLEKLDAAGRMEFSEDWHQTDEQGNVPIRVSCPSGGWNPSEEGGAFMQELVSIQAVKDGTEFEASDVNAYVAFAYVRSADRTYWVANLSGELSESIYPGYTLKPGDSVQIGTALTGGDLSIEFYNGRRVDLNADILGGFRGHLNASGEVSIGSNLFWLDLRNKAQDWIDDPRRMLRMQVYKQLGNAVDAAIGTPDSVGWMTTTPGGHVEEILCKWGESAYRSPGLNPDTLLPYAAQSARSGIKALAATSQSDGGTFVGAERTAFSFYSDGTVYVQNMAGNVEVSQVDGGSFAIPAGAGMLIQLAPDASVSVLHAPATSTAMWTAGAPQGWTFSPTNHAAVASRFPVLSADFGTSGEWVTETARLRLDGRDISPRRLLSNAQGLVAAEQAPLTPGSHTLSMSCMALTGERSEQSIVFEVAAAPDAAEAVGASACRAGVWVGWQAAQGVAGYRVWRAAAEHEDYTLLTTTTRTQPGYWDASPLSGTNWYWIETVDGAGRFSSVTQAVACVWEAQLPAAPSVGAIGLFALRETAQGVEISCAAGANVDVRWRVERSAASGGGFVQLEPGEDTLADEFLDRTVVPNETYTYRLTPLSADGVAGEPQTGSMTTGTVPGPATGLEAFATTGSVIVMWDPCDDFRALGTKVYRSVDGGTTYLPLATLPPASNRWTDVSAPPGSCLYQICRYGSDGEAPAMRVGVSTFTKAETPAIIAVDDGDDPFVFFELIEGAREADGFAYIPVTRSGNLDETVFVRYATSHYAGTATAEEDFTPTAGTLVFEPGQTTAAIAVPIVADDVYEEGEYFYLALQNSVDGAVEVTDRSAYVAIGDSDVVTPIDRVWFLTFDAAENETNALFWIERESPSTREVSVEVALANEPGNAVPGVDYVAFAPRRIVFAANETRKAFSVALLDDAVKDGEKTIQLELRAPLGGACVNPSRNARTLAIRDDESHPGRIVPGTADHVIRATGLQDTVRVPFLRAEGADGSLQVNVYCGGGSLSWDAVSCSAYMLDFADGVTSNDVLITLDRTAALDTRIAPFTVVTVMSSSPPFESEDILVLFRHAEGTTPAFRPWADTFSLGALSAPEDDADGDGASNIEEFALGSNPALPTSRPVPLFTVNGSGLTLTPAIRPDPNLAVVGVFKTDLTSDTQYLSAGYWSGSWDAASGRYLVQYSPNVYGVDSCFGRLLFIWMGE